MRGLLRIVIVVILTLVLLHLAWRFLTLAVPILVTVGAIALVVFLIRRLCRKGRRSECLGEQEGRGPVPRWRTNLDRIERRIESLETILLNRANRRRI
jgi:hypothetical protein